MFLADLGAITALALVTSVLARRLDLGPLTVQVAATALTVGLLAGVAVVAAAGGRAQRDGRFGWIGAAFGLFALLGLPLCAVGPLILRLDNGLVATLGVAQAAVAVLLLLAALVPGGPGRLTPWVAGGAGLFLALAAGTAGRHLPLSSLPVEAVAGGVVAAWGIAALAALRDGLRQHDSAVWRVGLSLAVMAVAQLHAAVAGTELTDPTVTAVGLWLVGAAGALAAVLRGLRRSVSGLLSTSAQQRAELHEAAQHVERAAALARERDHELANGLAGLAGIAYLLEQPADRPEGEGAELRSAVLAEIARLHTMLARPAAAVPGGVAHGSFDLATALTELVALRRAGGQDVALHTETPTTVRADRGAIAQVVTNLLVNAARHAPGSHVEVCTSRTGHQVVVEVDDDGPGAPPGSEDALVEEGVTAGPAGGSGLGLAVSRRLVREQGGDLRVLPTDGDGFAVRFTLPAVAARVVRPAGHPARVAS